MIKKSQIIAILLVIGVGVFFAANSPFADQEVLLQSKASHAEELWRTSGHADSSAEAFVHWDEDGEIPTFCAKCHSQSDRIDAASVHWIALGTAHIPSDSSDSNGEGGVLDSQTRQCLSCHDGATASESKNVTPWTASRGDMGDSRRNHPVGVSYMGLSRPRDLSPLRPAGLLPPDVSLPDGKVACVSCHNLYAGGRFTEAGGVSANGVLREQMTASSSLPVRYPPLKLCVDNGAMIASAGYFRYVQGYRDDLAMDIRPSWPLVSIASAMRKTAG